MNLNNALVLNNLTFTYPGKNTPVLKDINLKIERGSFTAIMGSNGSGKTTLCKLFNGIIPHFFSGDLEGEVLVDGLNTLDQDVGSLSELVGYVHQDFKNSIVRSKVFDEVCYAPLNYGYDDYQERAEKSLEILGIQHLKEEYIWQLSGGQQHLVALACVVAMEPEYIVVDEPVAQLDPHHAHALYGVLNTLNKEYNKTIIVIEHHAEFVANYCTDVVLLNEGNLVWMKPVQAALTDYDTLLSCQIYPPQVTQLMKRLNTKSELPITLNQAYTQLNGVIQKEVLSTPSRVYDKQTLSLHNITSGYQNMERIVVPVIKNISLTCYENERIAIVGNNGSGKSTLLKVIARLNRIIEGSLSLNGHVYTDQPSEITANQIGVILQNPEEMFIEDSVHGDISYFLRARKYEGIEEYVNHIIKTLNLVPFKNSDPRLLSGGQQRRVSLGIGMGMRPEILLLDEPTSSLDINSRQELIKLLDSLKETIKTVIIATHDMQLVADWATRVIVLNQGNIIFDGTPFDLFQNQQILEQSNLIIPEIIKLGKKLSLKGHYLSVDDVSRALGG